MEKTNIKILYFWSEKCTSCKTMRAHVEELEKDGWSVEKINTDTNSGGQRANRYGCMGVPTIVILKDGEMINRRAGLMSTNAIKELLT